MIIFRTVKHPDRWMLSLMIYSRSCGEKNRSHSRKGMILHHGISPFFALSEEAQYQLKPFVKLTSVHKSKCIKLVNYVIKEIDEIPAEGKQSFVVKKSSKT
jgi:hypothetical protein